VRDVEVSAKRVQHRFAANAEPRLVEPRWIIDTGMNDFAVARTDPGANPALAFDDDHFPPGSSERSRDGETDDARADDETDDARADDETLDRFHLSTCCSKWSVLGGSHVQR
jgi:hypothetical protein